MNRNPAIQCFRREHDYTGRRHWFIAYADVAEREGYHDNARSLRHMASCARLRTAAGWLLVAVSCAVIIYVVLS